MSFDPSLNDDTEEGPPLISPNLSWWHPLPSRVTAASLCPDFDLIAVALANPPPHTDAEAESLLVRNLNGRHLCSLPIEPVMARDRVRAFDEADDDSIEPLSVPFRALRAGVDAEITVPERAHESERLPVHPTTLLECEIGGVDSAAGCAVVWGPDAPDPFDAATTSPLPGEPSSAVTSDDPYGSEDDSAPSSLVTSLCWLPGPRSLIALGLRTGAVAIVDCQQQRRVSWVQAHAPDCPVVSMQWMLSPLSATNDSDDDAEAAAAVAAVSAAASTASSEATAASAIDAAAAAAAAAAVSATATEAAYIHAITDPSLPIAPLPPLPLHTKNPLMYERDRKMIEMRPTYGRALTVGARVLGSVGAGSPFVTVPTAGAAITAVAAGTGAQTGVAVIPQSPLLAAAMVGIKGKPCDARGALAGPALPPLRTPLSRSQPLATAGADTGRDGAAGETVPVLVTTDAKGRVKLWAYGWSLIGSLRVPRGALLPGGWGALARLHSQGADTHGAETWSRVLSLSSALSTRLDFLTVTALVASGPTAVAAKACARSDPASTATGDPCSARGLALTFPLSLPPPAAMRLWAVHTAAAETALALAVGAVNAVREVFAVAHYTVTSKLIAALPDELKKKAASDAQARASRWASLTGNLPPSAAFKQFAAASGAPAATGDGDDDDMFGLGGGLGDDEDDDKPKFGLSLTENDPRMDDDERPTAGTRALARARARLHASLAHLAPGSRSSPADAATTAAAEKQWADAADAAEPDQIWVRENLAHAILCGLTAEPLRAALGDSSDGVLEPARFAVSVAAALEHWRTGCAILLETLIPALTCLTVHLDALRTAAVADPSRCGLPLSLLVPDSAPSSAPAIAPELSRALSSSAAALTAAHAALSLAEHGYGALRGFGLWLGAALGGTLDEVHGIIDGAGERITADDLSASALSFLRWHLFPKQNPIFSVLQHPSPATAGNKAQAIAAVAALDKLHVYPGELGPQPSLSPWLVHTDHLLRALIESPAAGTDKRGRALAAQAAVTVGTVTVGSQAGWGAPGVALPLALPSHEGDAETGESVPVAVAVDAEGTASHLVLDPAGAAANKTWAVGMLSSLHLPTLAISTRASLPSSESGESSRPISELVPPPSVSLIPPAAAAACVPLALARAATSAATTAAAAASGSMEESEQWGYPCERSVMLWASGDTAIATLPAAAAAAAAADAAAEAAFTSTGAGAGTGTVAEEQAAQDNAESEAAELMALLLAGNEDDNTHEPENENGNMPSTTQPAPAQALAFSSHNGEAVTVVLSCLPPRAAPGANPGYGTAAVPFAATVLSFAQPTSSSDEDSEGTTPSLIPFISGLEWHSHDCLAVLLLWLLPSGGSSAGAVRRELRLLRPSALPPEAWHVGALPTVAQATAIVHTVSLNGTDDGGNENKHPALVPLCGASAPVPLPVLPLIPASAATLWVQPLVGATSIACNRKRQLISAWHGDVGAAMGAGRAAGDVSGMRVFTTDLY